MAEDLQPQRPPDTDDENSVSIAYLGPEQFPSPFDPMHDAGTVMVRWKNKGVLYGNQMNLPAKVWKAFLASKDQVVKIIHQDPALNPDHNSHLTDTQKEQFSA